MTLSGMLSIISLICAMVLSIAFLSTVGPNPFSGWELGSWPIRSKVSKNSANAHSLSVPPVTPKYHLSASLSPSLLLICFHPPRPPLCIHIKLPWQNGWQLSSLREPSVVARTWAKIRREAVFEASRWRFEQFQAGVVEVKRQGAAPSFESV